MLLEVGERPDIRDEVVVGLVGQGLGSVSSSHFVGRWAAGGEGTHPELLEALGVLKCLDLLNAVGTDVENPQLVELLEALERGETVVRDVELLERVPEALEVLKGGDAVGLDRKDLQLLERREVLLSQARCVNQEKAGGGGLFSGREPPSRTSSLRILFFPSQSSSRLTSFSIPLISRIRLPPSSRERSVLATPSSPSIRESLFWMK